MIEGKCIGMFTVTLHCTKGCHETVRIARGDLGGTDLPYLYCPLCGVQGALAECDPDMDWWEAMEQAFELPRLVLEPIYELWRTDEDREYHKFRDYFNAFKSQTSEALVEEVMKYAE